VLARVGRRRKDERGDAVAAQPAEVDPVLVPAIDEDGDPRVRQHVLDTGERERIGRPLRLLVDRRIEDRLGVVEDEADRHEARSSIRPDRRKDRAPGGREEGSLGRGEDGLG